jgi:hypothetical protein
MRVHDQPLVLVLLVFLSLPLSKPAAGQTSSVEPAPAAPVVVRGADLPQYTVVKGFFNRAIAARRDASPWRYHRLLENLGIAPGSEAEKRLERALSEAEAVLAMPTVDPSINQAETYWAFQMKALGEKARALGHVYATLLRDLRRSGPADEALQTYLEAKVRPNTSMHTKNEWPQDVLRALESFDREVDAVLQGELP